MSRPDDDPLYWRVHGTPGELPDFVLEHGGGGSSGDWRQLEPLLAAHGRVFAYDRAGAGRSPRDDLGCSAPAVTQRLAQLLERMPVRKPFVLVGYSLGGLYARHFAAQHPQCIAGLVLVDSTPTGHEIRRELIRRALRLLWLLHWAARSGLATLTWRLTGSKNPESFRRTIAEMSRPGYLRDVRAEIDAIAGIQAEVARVAPQLRHPTLAVIAGTARKSMDAAEFAGMRALHDALARSAPAPLSALAVVDAADHGTLVGDPRHAAELADRILAFARRLPPVR
jgi:pimeloyl-ACP methyl ester carboxylesterase